MQNALLFIARTLFELYLLTFVLRLLLQGARVDARHNPFVQFILRVTNPLVIPLRRVMPPIGRIDTATLVALIALQVAATFLLVGIGCVGGVNPLQVLGLAALGLVSLLLKVYFWGILIYVIMSWVGQGGYNAASALIGAIIEPVLAPFRRIIPAIGGLDLSPLFAMIALQAVTMLLPTGRLLSAMMCSSMAAPLL